MSNISFSNNELEIMNLMWHENRPLTRTEIIDLSPERSWSKSSIHILLNRLIEKEAIEVSGFVRTGKNYGRTYSPLVTQEDYILSTLNSANSPFCGLSDASSITSIFAALIQSDTINGKILDELEQMIAERKKKNNT